MAPKAKPTFSLKDQLFNAETVAELADALKRADSKFKRDRFLKEAIAPFPTLELKERITWLVQCLTEHLPTDFAAATELMLAALPPPLDPTRSDDDFGKFIWIVPGEYVATHGCNKRHLTRSLKFLREATMRFSSEGAVRPFLRDFPEPTLAFLKRCAQDRNYHVRRWSSEGVRPFLPWALQVELPLDDVVSILDQLHADPTRYVTRSVANALNDISKIDPERTLATLRAWKTTARQRNAELEWMTRHALRTLRKQGHKQALGMLGYSATPRVAVEGVSASTAVRVGDSLEWKCVVVSERAQRLDLSLRIHFLKANGKHSTKVFALKDLLVRAKQRVPISKRISFKPITTRTLYPGLHAAELLANGKSLARKEFELVDI